MDESDTAEWTDDEIARARPATEMLPAWAVRALVEGDGGVRIGLQGQRQWALQSTLLAS